MVLASLVHVLPIPFFPPPSYLHSAPVRFMVCCLVHMVDMMVPPDVVHSLSFPPGEIL
jgi:hypothetical protein